MSVHITVKRMGGSICLFSCQNGFKNVRQNIANVDLKHQLETLWLKGHKPLASETEAVRFMKAVGFALRYNATSSLPLASMYKAAGDTRRAIELTNALLARGDVIECNVIADRLVLIHCDIVPAVFALRSRLRPAKRNPDAERVFQWIQKEGRATSGEVRRYLGIAGQKRPDRGDIALGELQRDLLIDRGPSSVPKNGIPYLSPEGFPYRIFDTAHPDIVQNAAKLPQDAAARLVIETYLRAAVFVTPRKLSSMFRLLITETEMTTALEHLELDLKISRTSKYVSIRS
jgi:hypothetical protein